MKSQNVLKRTLAGVLAVLTVAGSIPANVGTGGLFGGSTIAASAFDDENCVDVTSTAELQSAIDAAESNVSKSIRIADDFTVTSKITVAADKVIDLDLNGHTITAKSGIGAMFSTCGNLKISDRTEGQEGKIEAVDGVVAIINYGAGVCTIESGTICKNGGGYLITQRNSTENDWSQSAATLNICGSARIELVVNKNNSMISAYGTVNIYDDAVLTSTAQALKIEETGICNVYGGTITGGGASGSPDQLTPTVYNFGSFYISNGTINNTNDAATVLWAISYEDYPSYTTVDGGTIDNIVISTDGDATVTPDVTINNGEIGYVELGGTADGVLSYAGDLTINGGQIGTVHQFADAQFGSLNINGGNVDSVELADDTDTYYEVNINSGNVGTVIVGGDDQGTNEKLHINTSAGVVQDRQNEGGVFSFGNKSRISSIVISGVDEDGEPYEDKVNLKRFSETEVNAGETVTVITKAPAIFKNPAGNDIALESVAEDDESFVYEYKFIMPGWDVSIEYETYEINNWVGAEIEAESDNGRFYPGDEITITANEKDNIGFWDDDGNWVELTDPLDSSVYDAETGKYTYTVVMPRRDITVRGYAHEHQYEYTVNGAQVIRTCTLEDGERNGDCEPAVMTLISNDWDNGPIASESVVFNPMGPVGVWLTDWPDGSWIDFYQVDEDGNETHYDYYDHDRTPVGKYKAVAHYLAPDGEFYEPTLEFTVTPFNIFAYHFTAYESYTSFVNDNNRLNDDDDNTASGTYTTYDPDGVQLNVNGMIDWGENKYWLQEDIDYEILGRTIAKGFGANSTVIRMMGNFKGEITVNWDIELPDKLDPDFEVNRFGENNFYQEQEYGYTWGELLDTLGFNDNTNYDTDYDGSPERLTDEDISYQYFNTDDDTWVDIDDADTIIPIGTYEIRAAFGGNEYFNSGVSTNAGNINITPRNLWVKTDDAGVSKNDVDSSLGALEQAAADLVTIYAYDENGTQVPVDIDNANFEFRFYRHDDESNTDYLVENDDQLAELDLGERIRVYITDSSDLGNDNYSLGYSFSNYDNESGTDVYTDEYIGDIRITGSAEIKEENITYTAKQIANGEWLSPDVKVYDDDGNELVLGQDYVLRGDKKASEKGVYTIIVQGWGDTYDGCPSIELNWEIVDEAEAARISGRSTTLDQELLLNIIVTVPDELKTDNAAYIRYTYDGESTDLLISEMTPDASGRYIVSVPVIAGLAFADVNIQIFDGEDQLVTLFDKDGNDVTADGYNYSLEDYMELAAAAFEGTGNKMYELALATIDYCTATHIFVRGNTENLTYENRLGKTVTSEELEGYAADDSELIEGISKVGMAVTCVSDNQLRVIFTFDSTVPVSEYTCKIDGEDAELIQQSDNKYYLELRNIRPTMLDNTHDFEISYNGETFKTTRSILTYSKLAIDTGIDNYVNFGNALYQYNQAAIDYFGDQ